MNGCSCTSLFIAVVTAMLSSVACLVYQEVLLKPDV